VTSDTTTPSSEFRVPSSAFGRFRAVVMGASAGGRDALAAVLSRLPPDYAVPVLIVQHLHPDDDGGLADSLARATPLRVVAPCDKQCIEPGCVYVAPANYHRLVERIGSIALSTEGHVNWSRPSIDVLFESAAHVYGEQLLAVILTGANGDGTQGMRTVRALGGRALAQDPATAENPVMPQSAIDAGAIDEVLNLMNIAERMMDVAAESAMQNTPKRCTDD